MNGNSGVYYDLMYELWSLKSKNLYLKIILDIFELCICVTVNLIALKMPLFIKLFFLFMLIFLFQSSFSQTYISSGRCNPMDLEDPNCWDISDTCAGGNNTTNPFAFRNLTEAPNACPVRIILNHAITYEGNLTFGGSFDSLIIGDGGSLTINGDLIVEGQKKVKVFMQDGGELNISDELILQRGGTQNKTILQINGDSSSFVKVGKIDLQGEARLNIKQNGGLISSGETRYNGNSSEINVEGVFITNSLTIQGGSGHRLNIIDQGKVGIENDLTIAGSSIIDITGTSEVEVGGDLVVGGNAKLNIKGTSTVSVCGTKPALSTRSSGVQKDPDAEYLQSCDFRILPVDFIYFISEFDLNERKSIIIWSTSKEWENSHFDIERSIDAAQNFEKIAEVAGMGWTDEVTEYSYEDEVLPLAGGNVFYRLKQVDFNGKYEYSDITAVRVPNVHFTKGIWRAYPNPMVGSSFSLELVDLSQYHDESIILRILSSNISSNEMTFNSLLELNDRAGTLMANAPTGLWIFEIRWGNKVERIKVMKK